MKNLLYVVLILGGLTVMMAKLELVEVPYLSDALEGKAQEGGSQAEQRPAEALEPAAPAQTTALSEPESTLELESETPMQTTAISEPEPTSELEPETPMQTAALSEAVSKPELEPEPPMQTAALAKSAPSSQPESGADPEPEPGTVPPDEVVAGLHATYEVALAEHVESVYEAGLDALATSYLSALEREERAAQGAADLDAMLAWRNESNRVRGEPPAGETQANPGRLVQMREAWEREQAKLENEHEARKSELRAKYDAALAGHERALTQASKIEEALAVREWRTPFMAAAEQADQAAFPLAAAADPAQSKWLTESDIEKGEVGDEREIMLPGGIPMIFCWCPPGKFLMGSPADEEGREGAGWGLERDETQHLVELTKGFWLGKYEVTQAQWTAVMGTTVEEQHLLVQDRDTQPWLTLSGIGADQPMYFVSWEESVEFCRKLGRLLRLPGRWEFGLPTEAQWEYACRAGTTEPFGGTGILDEMGWFSGNSGGTSHPVGKKKPNAWGLHDMHGNVWEWCRDWFGDYPHEEVTDPTGPRGGSHRVSRGGAHGGSGTPFCRSAARHGAHSNARSTFQGFRVAVSSNR